MKINVIGGSGFIGSRLVNRLIKHHKVRIIDKQTSPFYPDLVTIADVRDPEKLSKALEKKSAIINLAAEHKDNVRPKSLYDEVNVQGARNICRAAEENKIDRIIFTSSVAVYGFAPKGTNETGKINPFNDYGRTKWAAEEVFTEWALNDKNRTLVIIRPTVVFGERNRGNVYNLLRQISSGSFIMVGSGKNKKSMAYVENVAAFIEYALSLESGIHVFNYIDKPDFTMDQLVKKVNAIIKGKSGTGIRIPFFLGYLGGKFFDLVSRITHKEFPISAIRVKKFVSDTLFDTSIPVKSGFVAPVNLETALYNTIKFEFIDKYNGPLFYSE